MRTISKAGLVSLFVMIIFFIAIPQPNTLHSIAIALLIVSWIFPILIIGIPSWWESIDNSWKGKFTPITTPLIFVLLPYLLILAVGGTQLTSFIEMFIWYLLPAILFLLPEIQSIEDKIGDTWYSKIKLFLILSSAIILWIGFDHRYTTVLFEGFIDASYVLNALWMACIIIVTYGRSIGVRKPNNPHDIGLKPSWYAIKIANITTPAAALIVIPFGLLTGFLLLNPQEFNPLKIIITFIGIFLTIALQEELIFRGIFQHELVSITIAKSSQYIEYLMIIGVTVLFALTHWNNETITYVYHYFLAAFVAGLAYAVSYRKAGLFSAMLAHTLVDWVWALLLKRV